MKTPSLSATESAKLLRTATPRIVPAVRWKPSAAVPSTTDVEIRRGGLRGRQQPNEVDTDLTSDEWFEGISVFFLLVRIGYFCYIGISLGILMTQKKEFGALVLQWAYFRVFGDTAKN